MKFKVEIEIEVADDDADVMVVVPEAIKQRFIGTAVVVENITVTRPISWGEVLRANPSLCHSSLFPPV